MENVQIVKSIISIVLFVLLWLYLASSGFVASYKNILKEDKPEEHGLDLFFKCFGILLVTALVSLLVLAFFGWLFS